MNHHRTPAPASLRRLSAMLGVFLAVACALLPLPLLAQETGTVSGRVLNSATGTYLANAVVQLAGTTQSTVTGSGGVYTLLNVPVGSAQVTVTYTGLDPTTSTVAITAGQTSTLDFELTSKVYDEDVVRLGEYVVSTQREGNAKAIQDQRVAVNLKKVIASDALGNVSEGNVGEFLKQMPGVAMDYVEADVRQIRVRGYSPKYATVMIDGTRVASAGSSDIGVGRAFEFEQLSIASIESVELSKTPTPDQPSTVAGVVNLRSKGAFDRKGRRLTWFTSLYTNSHYLSLQKTYNWDDQQHYKLMPNFGFEFSDVVDNKLGVVAGYTQSYTLAAQKHIWVRAYTFDADPTNNATEVPRANNYNFQDGPKPTKRENYNVRFDYKIGDHLTVWGKLDYNVYDAAFFNRNFWLNITSVAPASSSIEYSRKSQTVTAGTAQMTGDGGASNKFGDTMLLSGGFTYKKGALTWDTLAQTSTSKNFYENLRRGWFDSYTATTGNITFRWDRPSADSNEVTFTPLAGSATWTDPAAFTFNSNALTQTLRRGKDRQNTIRSDLRYNLEKLKVPVVLKFGLYTNENERATERINGMQYDFVGADLVRNSGDNDLPKNWIETGFKSDWGWGGNSNGWPTVDRFALGRLYQTNPGYFVPNTLQHLQAQLQNQFQFHERIDAAYFQPIFKFGRLDVAPGVRIEKTDSWGRGPLDIGDAAARRAVGLPATGGSTATSSYVTARYGKRMENGADRSDAFGYLHANYRITDSLVARASYHQAITRADMANLIPGIGSVDEVNHTLTANNPELRPELSDNFNLGLEYYFEPVGVISVSYFGSKIKDLQRRLQVPVADTWLSDDPTYAGYTVNVWENVASSKTSGIEVDYSQQLSFLPGALKGLGVFANYTRLHFDNVANYFGSPKTTWNAGVNFSWKKFYVQYKVNFTGKKQFTAPTNGWNEFDGERLMMDVNMTYSLAKNLSLFVNGRNINDEPLWSYTGDKTVWRRYLTTGSMWEAGIKGTF